MCPVCRLKARCHYASSGDFNKWNVKFLEKALFNSWQRLRIISVFYASWWTLDFQKRQRWLLISVQIQLYFPSLNWLMSTQGLNEWYAQRMHAKHVDTTCRARWEFGTLTGFSGVFLLILKHGKITPQTAISYAVIMRDFTWSSLH